MDDIHAIEICYKKISQNLKEWFPEGIISVNVELLEGMNLHDSQTEPPNDELTRYFHVIESQEKITLINEDFVVWKIGRAHV